MQQFYQLSIQVIIVEGKQTARQLNPIPYHDNYFGQKLHVHQNEKLVMFGVTHIRARDGYGGKIVSFASMPVKNNVEIYKHVFRYIHVYFFVLRI